MTPRPSDSSTRFLVVPTTPDTRPPSRPDENPLPLTMPGSAERAARDIDRIGVEGRPADAKSGPGMLTLELAGIFVAVIAIAVGMGLWMDWRIGVAIFLIGSLGLVANPVIAATAMRIRDRKQVADDTKSANSPPNRRSDPAPR